MDFTSMPELTTLAFPGIAAARFKAKATFDLHVKIKPLEFPSARKQLKVELFVARICACVLILVAQHHFPVELQLVHNGLGQLSHSRRVDRNEHTRALKFTRWHRGGRTKWTTQGTQAQRQVASSRSHKDPRTKQTG